jgi:methyltransferase-like protein/2-polyprenyl-3-methyl-5-hydroxy-6-metoxy-1,4-benzoquinol methylase
MSETLPTSYDVVPYESNPFLHTHPDRLATAATLFGMKPTAVDRCRVLELGCASGGNLIPMAQAYPESRFVGIDLSRRQIADGQQVVEALGLPNIELMPRSIVDVNADFGQFDYLICHGVYSWVPPQVQDKILEICAWNLSPNGVAYVSYNTYPGWHMRGMIRDMMCYRARRYAEPQARVNQARALLDFLAQSVPGDQGAYSTLLKDELEFLRRCSDSYLLHEHLEEWNDPIYFYQFAERAAAKGLQYLGEAQLSAMLVSNFSPEVGNTLRLLSADLIEVEQYMDFLRNRMFRQTLLCRKGITLKHTLYPECLPGFYVASPAKSASARPDLQSNAVEQFRTPGGTLSTPHPIVKAAMAYLAEIWPRSESFETLLATSRTRLSTLPLADEDKDSMARDLQVLGTSLLECYASPYEMVELRVCPPRFVLDINANPVASPLARLQALASPRVTNLRHELVQLSEFSRQVLRRLDGSRNRATLLHDLASLVAEGNLVVQQDGRPVKDARQIQETLSETLDQSLPELARAALLVG